ncbi:unnamed protein product [Rhizoctonia solani]|uniref:Uncharacterized protein n=1 Tax=Rhizoctonia solani TaxID=456999 RepID=A0A8H2WP80_9AGAM|nr:unnamed protein product [Rhizoctonia solani]
MYSFLQAVVVVALSGLALAIPAPTKTAPFDKRTISGVTAADCDGFTFTSSQVAAAASAAASRVAAGTTVGSNAYPHVFNNREGKQNHFPIWMQGALLRVPSFPLPSLHWGRPKLQSRCHWKRFWIERCVL